MQKALPVLHNYYIIILLQNVLRDLLNNSFVVYISQNSKIIIKMDTGAATIVLVIVALIVLPFIFHKLYKKMKDMKFQKDFMSMAERDKVVFSQKELWNNCYAIGIDNNSGKLLYANKKNSTVEGTLIDLSEVEKCRIANINRTFKTQSGNSNVSDRLELVFSFRKSDMPEKILEFYDSQEFMPTDKEIILTENWLNIINSNINRKK
jgi:hypothetical protein